MRNRSVDADAPDVEGSNRDRRALAGPGTGDGGPGTGDGRAGTRVGGAVRGGPEERADHQLGRAPADVGHQPWAGRRVQLGGGPQKRQPPFLAAVEELWRLADDGRGGGKELVTVGCVARAADVAVMRRRRTR